MFQYISCYIFEYLFTDSLTPKLRDCVKTLFFKIQIPKNRGSFFKFASSYTVSGAMGASKRRDYFVFVTRPPLAELRLLLRFSITPKMIWKVTIFRYTQRDI